MPRKTQRFGKLIEAYRANGGTAASGSKLDHFGQWLTGKVHIKQVRRPSHALMQRQRCIVEPFGLTPTGNANAITNYLCGFSGQAYAIWSGITDNGIFGLTPIKAADTTTTYVTESGFYPALAKVFTTQTANTASTKNNASAVTGGDPYSRTLGRSGSIPFGRTIFSEITTVEGQTTPTDVLHDNYDDSLEAILKHVKGKLYGTFFVKAISFSPEVYVEPRVPVAASDTPPTLTF